MYSEAPVELLPPAVTLVDQIYGCARLFSLCLSLIIILCLLIDGLKNGYIKRMIMGKKEEKEEDVDFNNRYKKYKKKCVIALVAIITINALVDRNIIMELTILIIEGGM